jgi:DNA repair exonuclease SbcCD ATPase subunit
MPLTIETLKQFALDVHNFAYGTKWDDEDIVSAMDFDGIIEEMKKDEKELEEGIAKLKNENKELKKHIQTVAKVQGGQMERDADNLAEAAQQIEALKHEVSTLEEVKEQYEDAIQSVVDVCGFDDEDVLNYGVVAIDKLKKMPAYYSDSEEEDEE